MAAIHPENKRNCVSLSFHCFSSNEVCMFFEEFYGFGSYIEIFNPFWVNFVYDEKQYFCMWLPSFHNTIYWGGDPFSTVCSLLLCHSTRVGLFLGSLSCHTDPCICFSASTILFWLPWLCSIGWRPNAWCLPLCCFFSRLLCLFEIFCGSLWFLESFVLFLWKNILGVLIGITLNFRLL